MVEQTVNDIIELLDSQANILLPEMGGDDKPVASNLEELVGALGATEIDPLTLEPLGDEPEPLDPLEPESEEESPDPLETEPQEESPDPLEPEPEAETPDPLETEPEPIEIEQKKDT